MNNTSTLAKLLLWIASFQFIGWLMGQATKINLVPWYQTLIKSPLTPPSITFGIVWSILYVFLAIIGYWVFTQKEAFSKLIQKYYAVQMLLNWSWTPVFFSAHETGFAAIILTSMVVINAYLSYLLCLVNKRIFYLNIIYQLWIMFALYLNLYVFIHN